MRKLILATTLILMSASAYAGPSRGLIVASNDGPKLSVAEQIKALGPEQANVQKAEAKPEAKAETAAPAKTESKPEAKANTKAQPKPVVKKRETDEQKARRIAARYGISW